MSTKFQTCVESGGYRTVAVDDIFIVATFAPTPGGNLAFAAFREGLVNTNHTLYDTDRRRFIVGTADQLTEGI